MRDLYVILIILTIISLMHILESNAEDDLEEDLLEVAEEEKIKSVVKKVIKERNKVKTRRDYIRASKSGLIRGCIIGYALGDYGSYSAIISGGAYAVINPIMMYISCCG